MIRLNLADQSDSLPWGGAISIGNFDGVHRGHAALINQLCDLATDLNCPSVVVTFDPSPASILRPNAAPPPLTWIQRRVELLQRCGVDHVVVCKTDSDLLKKSAREFFDDILIHALGARGIVEGPNFYFGRDRAGDVKLLAQLCKDQRISFRVADAMVIDGEVISSTRTRELIERGDIAEANRLLTAPYRLRGTVVAGASRGRTLGFPTANLSAIDTLVPAPGVYACRVRGPITPPHPAAVHVGPNPTFEDQQSKLEIHLIDFSGDLYGQTLEVEWIGRVRDVISFGSSSELRSQLDSDIETSRRMIADRALPPNA